MGVRAFVNRRIWLLRLGLRYAPRLARHARTRGDALKVLLLAVLLPPISGIGPRLHVRVRLREGDFTIADISEWLVLVEIFVDDAYPRAALPPAAKTIIDAGANIGATVRLFRRLYPDARIVALEPDPLTFELCRLNVAADPNVSLRQGAIAGSEGTLRLARLRGESWGTSIAANGDGFTAAATTLDALLRETGPVDLLKLDIEGAEWEVLRASTHLDQVGWIVGELHSEAGVDKKTFFELLAPKFEIVLDAVASDGKGNFALRRRDT
jgi:FkbM family methyltransferase